MVAAEAGWRWLRPAPPGPWSDRLESVLLLALVVAGAGGLGVLVGGGQPAQSLHYVYSMVAIGVLPTASFLARGRQPRTRAAAAFLAAIVALVVIARLFQTG